MQRNFYNQVIDKKGLKRILSWFIENYGPTRTSQLIEYFKLVGFHYATRAGLSLGFEDLKIPATKLDLLTAAQKEVNRCENNYQAGTITALERYQKLIDIWTTTSENLKEEVILNFQKTPLNPLYMMAFSGARGNISQVRQLVGMRGLMSDSGGGIIDFPIRSNFREGLSVTEYVISCYGARKGLIDTALRTADSGYLTRRLVDVAHSIMVQEIDCGTVDSISVRVSEKNLLGRVVASTIRVNFPGSKSLLPHSRVIAWKNQDMSGTTTKELLQALAAGQIPGKIKVRSPLTCISRGICQMCYGWNLAQGRFVSIGDAVGILAAQSIGEPGTQLTMRTFHTGGIFSTDVLDKIFAPHHGHISYSKLPRGCKVRSVHGETGFFTLESVKVRICAIDGRESVLQLPAQSLIFAYPGKYVRQNDLCAEISRLVPNGDVGPLGLDESVDQSTESFRVSAGAFGGSIGASNKTDDENASPVEGSFKIVLSEIQGQVGGSFSTGGSRIIPNEVWVLAGDPFDPKQFRGTDSRITQEGDLFNWGGSRGRQEVSKFNKVVRKQSFRGTQFLEVRGNLLLRSSQQKRVLKSSSLATASLVPPQLGDLVRSKDSNFKTEHTSQIIRKSARGTGPEASPFSASYSKIGKISTLSFVLRRVQPHLLSGLRGTTFEFPVSANVRPKGSIVAEREPLCQLLLPNQQSKTGDIVQGLPKIEQLFEGRGGHSFQAVSGSRGLGAGATSPLSTKISLIQQRLVDEIQSVYQSQGVEIADKHIEIIVRLMTSKVRILEKGTSPFFPDDIVDLQFVKKVNLPETYYEPIVLGITKVAFLTESFVSAASFQETKRVLMSSALQNRVDFLNGLKENVIVGRLIPAGTGHAAG